MRRLRARTMYKEINKKIKVINYWHVLITDKTKRIFAHFFFFFFTLKLNVCVPKVYIKIFLFQEVTLRFLIDIIIDLKPMKEWWNEIFCNFGLYRVFKIETWILQSSFYNPKYFMKKIKRKSSKILDFNLSFDAFLYVRILNIVENVNSSKFNL